MSWKNTYWVTFDQNWHAPTWLGLEDKNTYSVFELLRLEDKLRMNKLAFAECRRMLKALDTFKASPAYAYVLNCASNFENNYWTMLADLTNDLKRLLFWWDGLEIRDDFFVYRAGDRGLIRLVSEEDQILVPLHELYDSRELCKITEIRKATKKIEALSLCA